MVTVTNRRGTRGLLCAAVAGSLALAAAGCSGGDDGVGGKEADTSVAAERLCGGKAVSAEAGKALQVIMGYAQFEPSNEKTTVAAAARELGRTDNTQVNAIGDICRIYPPTDAPFKQLRVSWHLTGSAPEDISAGRFTLLPMGEQAGTAPDVAFVTFACHDGHELTGPMRRHITITVEPGGKPTEPEGDTKELEALKDAYATVAHSFSLAMAKELGCEDNGGLKAKPSLTPA
ncbi:MULTISPECIES: hypothetical protein [Streptomyces]|uniref:hypothetical protein n=1 Tax=Streptomyces TaxID=1883 RepID=UPI000A6D014E|nr:MULTISPECIES: hypothetical protein [Streptomyces]